MCRIKGIETVLGHIPVDETPCAVIQEDDRTGKQRTDYAVVHHQRKSKQQLHYPAQSDRCVLANKSNLSKIVYIMI